MSVKTTDHSTQCNNQHYSPLGISPSLFSCYQNLHSCQNLSSTQTQTNAPSTVKWSGNITMSYIHFCYICWGFFIYLFLLASSATVEYIKLICFTVHNKRQLGAMLTLFQPSALQVLQH